MFNVKKAFTNIATIFSALILAVPFNVFYLSLAYAEQPPTPIFSDSFSRDKNDSIGNNWYEQNKSSKDEKLSDSCQDKAVLAPSGANYVEFQGNKEGDSETLDASITHSVSTLGYQNIVLSYYRAQKNLEDSGKNQDYILVDWRLGEGDWQILEKVSEPAKHNCKDVAFNSHSYPLKGAENQTSIEIRFSLIGTGLNDKLFIDDISVTGETIPPPPPPPVLGCIDPTAANYNSDATQDDGSCTYPPQITNENATASVSNIAQTVITWITDHLATSRVIYDTVSHAVLGDPQNYGYAFSTPESNTGFEGDPKVTNHAVTLDGLGLGTTYYYRAVSHGSPESVSSESSFTTAAPTTAPPSVGPPSASQPGYGPQPPSNDNNSNDNNNNQNQGNDETNNPPASNPTPPANENTTNPASAPLASNPTPPANENTTNPASAPLASSSTAFKASNTSNDFSLINAGPTNQPGQALGLTALNQPEELPATQTPENAQQPSQNESQPPANSFGQNFLASLFNLVETNGLWMLIILFMVLGALLYLNNRRRKK